MKRRQLVLVTLVVAIVGAPFLALLYTVRAGLVVMAAALAATAWLVREAMPGAAPATRPWLRALLFVNLAFAIACLTALLVV